MMKYRKAFETGQRRLEEARIAEAALDARLLLEFVCGTDRNYLLLHGDREITAEEETQYFAAVERRFTHIPLQYITGEQEFMGLSFLVNQDVLIPRQDTETLVEEAMIEVTDGSRVLDMCTGSGCILLSLMRYKNGILGTGSDISEKALCVAEENSRRLGVEAEFIQSDMFENVEGTFDAVLSNPPYIRTDVIPSLMEEVRDHEPAAALDGREDGLYYYRILAERTADHLAKGGILIVETGYDQGAEVAKLFRENGYRDICIINDLAGHQRVVKGRK